MKPTADYAEDWRSAEQPERPSIWKRRWTVDRWIVAAAVAFVLVGAVWRALVG